MLRYVLPAATAAIDETLLVPPHQYCLNCARSRQHAGFRPFLPFEFTNTDRAASYASMSVGAEAARVLKQGKADRRLLWSTTVPADAQSTGRLLLAPGAEPKEPKGVSQPVFRGGVPVQIPVGHPCWQQVGACQVVCYIQHAAHGHSRTVRMGHKKGIRQAVCAAVPCTCQLALHGGRDGVTQTTHCHSRAQQAQQTAHCKHHSTPSPQQLAILRKHSPCTLNVLFPTLFLAAYRRRAQN
jgi:hypothetical protein